MRSLVFRARIAFHSWNVRRLRRRLRRMQARYRPPRAIRRQAARVMGFRRSPRKRGRRAPVRR